MLQSSRVWFGIICAIHIVALLTFASGFFLTRHTLEARSECDRNPSPWLQSDDTGSGSGCWMPRRADRLVLAVVDALRFDFAAHAEPWSPRQGHAPAWWAKLTVLRQLAAQASGDHQSRATADATSHTTTLLARFWADAPTTTMQRLKGLTTGSLPTFLDVRRNFASSAIDEDTWVHQLAHAGRRLVFAGDDTWMSLFPPEPVASLHTCGTCNRSGPAEGLAPGSNVACTCGGPWACSWPFPSFNVRDLHTVDRGVEHHLLPLLQHRPVTWDVLIGHWLGVDHVGHTWGPEHEEMTAKLLHMNETLARMVDALPRDTAMVVLGDHGMTPTGNHGGASHEELSATLWARVPSQGTGAATMLEHPIAQIDLVPSLALALGVPIPFGNLGFVIPEFFPQMDDLVLACHVNAWQLRRYLEAYAAAQPSALPVHTLAQLETLFHEADQLWRDWDTNETLRTHDQGQRIATSYREYHATAVKMCRRLWATFDAGRMNVGLGLAVCGALALLGYHWVALRAVCVQGPVAAAVHVVLLVLHVAALFTNSFIEAQHVTTPFLLGTVMVCRLLDAWRGERRRALVLLSVATLLVSITMRWSQAMADPATGAAARVAHLRTVSLAVIAVLCWAVNARVSPRASRLSGAAKLGLALVYGLGFGSILSFWELLRMPHDASPLVRWAILWLPRVTMACAVVPPLLALRGARTHGGVLAGCSLVMVYTLVAGEEHVTTVLGLGVALTCMVLAHKQDGGGGGAGGGGGGGAPHAGSIGATVAGTVASAANDSAWSAWLGMDVAWLAWHAFYALGHGCSFDRLQVNVAFIGLSEFNLWLSGAQLVLNTMGPVLLPAVVLVFAGDDRTTTGWFLWQYVVVFHGSAVATTAFVWLERRHLMVWRIFAPKFVFDALLSISVSVVITVMVFVWAKRCQMKHE